MQFDAPTRDVITKPPPPEGESELSFSRRDRLKFLDVMLTTLVIGIFAENRYRALFSRRKVAMSFEEFI
jgi:hypothetical protein